MELLHCVRADVAVRCHPPHLRDHQDRDEVAQSDAPQGAAQLVPMVHCGRAAEDRRANYDLLAAGVSAPGALHLRHLDTDLDPVAGDRLLRVCRASAKGGLVLSGLQ